MHTMPYCVGNFGLQEDMHLIALNVRNCLHVLIATIVLMTAVS